jgi:hypothetical protein
MQTYTGKAFYLFDPQPGDVCIEDIAHALALTCRYSGHTQSFYSVAQHAYLVAMWMQEDGYTAETCYAALHHDSAEAYTGDITPQLKDILGNFRELEDGVEAVIDIYFGIQRDWQVSKAIKHYDQVALATERRDLMADNVSVESWGVMADPRPSTIYSWDPDEAEVLFLHMDAKLIKEINDELDRYGSPAVSSTPVG